MFKRNPLTGVGIANHAEYNHEVLNGVAAQAHNLAGQVLGETGIFGTATFLLIILTILYNCRKIRRDAMTNLTPWKAQCTHLSLACRDTVILLAFEGIGAHNLLRYNWLWIAAFSSVALYIVEKRTD